MHKVKIHFDHLHLLIDLLQHVVRLMRLLIIHLALLWYIKVGDIHEVYSMKGMH
jgi:hypothetical protein